MASVVLWRRAARTVGVSLLLLVTLLAAAACDKTSEEPAEATSDEQDEQAQKQANEKPESANIVYADGPKPGPETVLAEAGEVEITFADFEEAMQRSKLVAPAPAGESGFDVPREKLAAPHLQLNVVRNLLSSSIIEHEAEERGLEASQAEKVEALRSKARLDPYAHLLEDGVEDAPELKKRGLELDDLDAIARELVLRRKLRDALLENVSDEALWQAYARQHDRAELLLAHVRNTPTVAEIDDFVEANADQIEAHFTENKRRYRQPKMVRLTMLRPERGEKVDAATLERAQEALATGKKPAEIAGESGLELEKSALLVRGENPEAFGSEPGKTGFQTSGPRGAYAWRVEGFRESEAAELNASLQREIAAELLSKQRIVPSRGARIEEAIDAMEKLEANADGEVPREAIDALSEELEAQGVEVVRTEMFARNERGFIPGVGLAEEVVERAFTLEEDAPVTDQPILSRRKVWAVRLLDREQPSREQFEADKEEFRAQFFDQMKNRVLSQFVAQYEDAQDAQFDLQPLRVEYGTLQKN